MTTDVAEAPTQITQTSVEDWKVGTAVLDHLLKTHNGCVSSVALRKELERKGVPDPRGLVVRMKFYDFHVENPELPLPGHRWEHHGKSFYSEEAYKKVMAETRTEAEDAAAAEPVTVVIEEEETPVTARRTNRQEEARLVTYVKDALVDIYATEYGPDREIAYDVHNQRPGNDFENVDVLAVHWRSDEVVDLITVEVKLEFNARLVQQANNYRRFCNRVWLAVPVQAEFTQAAVELREKDARLFDYVVDLGMGILACHRRQGRSYEVVPIHWPSHLMPDGLEREAFVERHRGTFEDAGVVAPRAHASYPKLR